MEENILMFQFVELGKLIVLTKFRVIKFLSKAIIVEMGQIRELKVYSTRKIHLIEYIRRRLEKKEVSLKGLKHLQLAEFQNPTLSSKRKRYLTILAYSIFLELSIEGKSNAMTTPNFLDISQRPQPKFSSIPPKL